ncbi:AAA family ATPase [Chloroflexi bacterium TSY]|nr:AAA family ATPase [Chloroflexi bacterium TSY]
MKSPQITSLTSLTPQTLLQGVESLAEIDNELARIYVQHGLPPMWDREPGFATLIHMILEQQVSLASARAAMDRLLEIATPLTPERFLTLDDQTLRTVGFSRQKTSYGRYLAQALVDGTLDLDALLTMSDDDARSDLCRLKGIGPWTADVYLLMVMRRPDIWPIGDRALVVAMREVKSLQQDPTPDEMDAIGESWRPWRSVAARLLWHYYLSTPRVRVGNERLSIRAEQLMFTKIYIQNYRSIAKATVTLSPFTLLIGANGTGKSNFLRLFKDLGGFQPNKDTPQFTRHLNYGDEIQKFLIYENGEQIWGFDSKGKRSGLFPRDKILQIFSINPDCIGRAESLEPNPSVTEDGTGAVRVLDSLKTGDREDLFDQIERDLKRYIPEIEKLSFIPGERNKQLQVRECSITRPIPLRELSDGTKLVLTILTIIHQENPPSFIGLEEIDRGLHPRLFQQIIELLFQITEEKDIQIVATTHNPYLVDEFHGREEAVVIVEKENGETTFTTLEERLQDLSPEEEPLGHLWYSGFVGGVPVQAK